MALKWGIASAGKISHDFVNAVGTLSDNDHRVVAVAARDLNRAREFAELHEIEKYYSSYEELANDSNVEAVYIGVLNPQHYSVAMLMLEHGKHVLCEKPLCMNEKEAKKLVAYAERKKLFLMEAIWSRFFPSYQYLRRQLDNGRLGDIQEVKVSFGFPLADVDRLMKNELGGGTILDLGVYTIQICQWVFQQPPKLIQATGKLNADGVDIGMKATLTYSDNVFATIETSATEKLDNKATIKGTTGEITLETFWCPTTLVDVDGQSKTWPLPETKHKSNFVNSSGLRYEADEVRNCIRNGLIQSSTVSHNESLIIASIEDEIRKQVGVVYSADA